MNNAADAIQALTKELEAHQLKWADTHTNLGKEATPIITELVRKLCESVIYVYRASHSKDNNNKVYTHKVDSSEMTLESGEEICIEVRSFYEEDADLTTRSHQLKENAKVYVRSSSKSKLPKIKILEHAKEAKYTLSREELMFLADKYIPIVVKFNTLEAGHYSYKGKVENDECIIKYTTDRIQPDNILCDEDGNILGERYQRFIVEDVIVKMKIDMLEEDTNDICTDSLEEIFALQYDLNKRIGLDTDDMTDDEREQWVLRFVTATQQELAELTDSCRWKWWKKDQVFDKQNARVEIIDLFHFVVSMALTMGMSYVDVLEAYKKKNQVNHNRQDKGYTPQTKDEDDCRHI